MRFAAAGAHQLVLNWDRSVGDSGAFTLAAAMGQCNSRCTFILLRIDDCSLTVEERWRWFAQPRSLPACIIWGSDSTLPARMFTSPR